MSGSDPLPSDIQTILANLQDEIRRHRAALGQLGAIEQPDPMTPILQHKWVNSHLPIGWPVMPQGIIPKLIAYAQKITRRLLRWYINPIIDQQNAYNSAVADLLANHQNRADQLAAQVRDLSAHVQGKGTLIERVLSLEEAQRNLAVQQAQLAQAQADIQTRQAEMVRVRLQRLENWYHSQQKKGGPALTEPSPTPTRYQAPPVDYFLLGAQYRNEEQMHARLHDYDDLFAELAKGQRDGRVPLGQVLDIGCGRGEFIDHLRDMGLATYGIEIDTDAIAIAREAGRDVRHEDAIAHLQSLPDSSLAAITLIQVIEHFDMTGLLALFRLAERKLLPGGFVVAETINPACLYALSNWYLLDPSHRTPLHPQMTQFLMEQAGLGGVAVRFLRPVPEAVRLESLSTATPELAEPMNRNLNKINQFLFGPQDYAAIAYKPED